MRHSSHLSFIQNTRYASRSHHLVWGERNIQLVALLHMGFD